MKILIVDDERPARERLQDLLARDGNHDVLVADNGHTALDLVHAQQPDTVLLDIRMPGMDGLETAFHLAGLESPPAVIFTTAYDDHALEAFEASAVDYLLKPIRIERLRQALDRAGALSRSRVGALRGTSMRTHISITGHGGIKLVPVAEVSYLRADQKYVSLGWQGRELLLNESLRALESEFQSRFLRVHRNTLVAVAHIEALEKQPDGGFQVRLRDVPRLFPVSRRHLSDVRRALLKGGSS